MNGHFRLIVALLMALSALSRDASAQPAAIAARTLEDRDRVTVMELNGNYDKLPAADRAQEEAIRKAIAQELLRLHDDDYDFVVSFTGFPFNLGGDEEGSRVGGRYYEIKNDIQGIGLGQFDQSAQWGSTGRLQGYIDMGALATLAIDPTDPLFERTLNILAHEVAHRWGSHMRFQNPDGSMNTSLLGRDSSHWSFFLQSHNSVLNGNDWRDNGNGTFTSVGRSRSFYSPLDLYAMGLLDRTQVPPFFVIEGAAGDSSRLPELGVTLTGTPRVVTVDDVIAAEGERIPDAAASPKQFKIAFVFLVRPGEDADGAQLRAINNIREAFATRMLILTGGKAVVEVFPDLPTPDITDPDSVLPRSSGPRTAPIDLAQGLTWLLSRQASDGRFADSSSTRVRDTAAVIDLLAGEPAAFGPRQAALAWLSTLQESSNVDTVARRLAAIAPQFSAADSAYLLGAHHPSGGWGLRPGDEADPFDTALALLASPAGDPGVAIARLVGTQLPDGSWPLHSGGPGSILATATALGLTGRIASAALNDALVRAGGWLETRQNNDGGFGESGSTTFETALAILHASRVASTRVDIRWAVEYLRRGQLADGSWNESTYETAMAIRALRIGELPNVSLVPSSLAFSPGDPVEGEAVTLSALLTNAGSSDLTNVIVRFYDGDPTTGGLPIGEDIVIASLPAQAQVPVTAVWNTTDKAGPHQILAVADPGFSLNESNETDNVLSGPLSVRPPPEGADLVVTAADLVFTPDLLRAVPQAQTLSARVANVGRTAAPDVQVALYAGDPTAGGVFIGQTVANVPARGGADVTIDFIISTPGERRFFLVADPANALTEADETNNAASRVLAVQSAIDLFAAPGSVTLSENPAALGRDLLIGAEVGNAGTADVFAARVRVFIDDPAGAIEVATLTLDLPAGQTRPISAAWRTSRVLSAVPVVIHVDPLNAFAETSEANNQTSLPLSVPASTDANLRVSHLELSVVSPVLQGGVATITVPVRNTGFANATDVAVAFYAGVPGSGGVQIGTTQTIGSLPSGGQAVASVVWDQITTFGDKLIYVVADPAGTIPEFDEQDNTAFITVDVLSLPDLAVSSASLSFSPAFPRNGEPVNLSALVSNLGEQGAPTVSVQLFLGPPTAGGLPIGPPQIVSVEGGAFASVHAQIDALTIGVSTIFVLVDAANQVPELNEANNIGSRTIGVQDGSFFFTNAYFSPNGDAVQDDTEFFFRLTEVSASTVHAIDRQGHVAREFSLENASSSGSVVWDGRDGLGRIVPDGNYSFALMDSNGSRLASVTVVVDNNSSPVGDALGTKYLIDGNLTCDATGPVSQAQFANPPPPFAVHGWLANDAGLVQVVTTQMICPRSTSGVNGFFFYYRCTFNYVSAPQAGVYITSPDGQSRTRITPDSWTANAYTGTPGTFVVAAKPSPDGEKVLVTVRKYRVGDPWYPNLQYLMEFVGPAELWVVNADGSGLVQVGTFDGPANTSAGVGNPEAAWSADGRRLAILAQSDGSHRRLYTLQADGSGQVLIDSAAVGTEQIYDVVWSPDSQRLIYAKQDFFTGVRAWQSVNADGSARIPMDMGGADFYPSAQSGMWLGNEHFANPIWNQATSAQELWLFSVPGAPPRMLAGNVNEAVVAPDHRSIAYVGRLGMSDRESDGIWRVDIDGNTDRLYTAAEQNFGIDGLSWTRDARRLAFIERVITDYRVCPGGEGGVEFCGSSFTSLGAVTVADRSVRVLQAGESVSGSFLGFFPDGNSFLSSRYDPVLGQRIVAVGIDDGRERVLMEGNNVRINDFYTPYLGFTPSGKYLVYESWRESLQAGYRCYKPLVGGPDVWILSSLLNLTTDFSFQRDQSQLVIRGTAEDRNFASYTLEATPAATPDQWSPIGPPNDAPAINSILATWIPPSEGTFVVRLTATDLAGNTASTRRRITWGLTPTITNLSVLPRVFSPDGNGTKDSITVNYVVLGPVNLEFTIFDAQNALVRTIAQANPTIGPASIAWDGRNDAGLVVAEGVYRIRVLDFSFFVTVDTTPPDVRLALGSSFRTVPEKSACVQTSQGLRCSVFPGPVVDTPVHQLTGRAADTTLATWTLESGIGANPSEWVVVDQGTDLLVARDIRNQPIVPSADRTIRETADARDVVDKRFRLSAVDQAGNATIVVTDLAPQEIILHAWDGVPVPTTRVLEQALGPHVLAVEQTVRAALQILLVQYRLQGSSIWVDGPGVVQPGAEFALPWDNASLSGGRTYEVRLLARDVDGGEYVSNEATIHSDLFELTRVESPFPRMSIAHGLASLREGLIDIRLVMDVAGDPDIGLSDAIFTDEVTFSIQTAPDPALDSCSAESVPARFKAIGESGRVYYSNVQTVTRYGPPGRACNTVGTGAVLDLSATRVFAAECGLPNPERVRIALRASGVAEGSLGLSIQDVPNGLFRLLPGVISPFVLELDTSHHADGTYLLSASAETVSPAGGQVTASASFVVDRTPPDGQITYPAANSMICPSRVGTASVIAIEGIAEDANFDHYEIAYGVGDNPPLWHHVFPVSLPEIEASRTPRRGVLANWDVSQLPPGTYTLFLKVFDTGGNIECHTITFTLQGGTSLRNVRAESRLLSPNADGNMDSAAVTFTLDTPALISARVFAVQNGQRVDTPIRTLLSNVQQLAGSNTLLWDGSTDLGAAAPDAVYHVEITTTDACGNPASEFVEVEVDTTLPDATISSPPPGDTGRILVEVRGTVSDIHFNDYRLEVGEGAVPQTWSPVSSGLAPVQDALLGQWNNRGVAGAFMLRLTATDTAGNAREHLVPIAVTANQPLIDSLSAQPLIFSPNADGRADTAAINYATTTATRVVVEVLSGDVVVSTPLPDTEASPGPHTVVWNGLSATGEPFTDGEYAVRVTATSAADPGRVQSEGIAIKVDTTAPTILVQAPLEDASVRGDVTVIGNVVDANMDSYAVHYGTAAAGPTVLLEEGAQSRIAYTFGTLRGLADGAHVVRVTVSDLAQNTTTFDRMFAIDDVSPAVALSSPETGAIAGGATAILDVRGSVMEPNLRDWTLRFGSGLDPATWTPLIVQTTAPASNQLSSWDTNGLADGTYTLSLMATDRAGATSEVRVQVIVDHTPPVAAIRQPSDGGRIGTAQQIRGDAADANFTTAVLEISEGPAETAFQFAPLTTLEAPVMDGVLFDMQLLPPDGVYTLRLIATDAAGLRTEVLSTVVIDTEPPLPPTNLAAVLENRRDARLMWTASGESAPLGYHVYRGSRRLTAVPVTATSYFDANLVDGTHRYTVTVVDAGGLESSGSNEAGVTVDLTAPAAHIQSPSNNSVVTDLVDIRGTAASAGDFREYRLLVGDGEAPTSFTLVRRSPAPVTSGVLAQVETLGRAPGAVITVRLEAEDLDGNVAADQVTVSIDNEIPATPILLAATPAGSAVTTTWQPVADTDIAGYLLYNNDLLANVRQFVTGNLTRYLLQGSSYVDTGLVDGNYEYYMVAVDRAGNISAPSNRVQVTIETRAPRATIVRPATGTRTDSPVVLEATTPDADVATVQFQFKLASAPTWSDLNGPVATPPYTTTWDPAGLALGSYQFRAVGTDVRGNVDAAAPAITIIHADLTPPAPPTDVRARVIEGQITLNWTASTSSDVAGYSVHRQFGAGPINFVVSGNTGTTFTHEVGFGDFTYYLTSYDTSSNQSGLSNPAPALVYSPLLTVPQFCLAAPLTDVEGSSATPFSTVTLFAPMTSGTSPVATTVAGADGTFRFTGVTLTLGVNTFTAQADDVLGNRSFHSSPIEVTFSASPNAVSGLAAQVSGNNVSLTWSPAEGATTYTVRRGAADVPLVLDVTSTGTATASSSYSDAYPASNATDGNSDTLWISAYATDLAPWWQVEFPAPVQWKEMRIEWYQVYPPRDFEVQRWDGAGWVTVQAFTANTSSDSVIVLDTAIEVTRLRVLVTVPTYPGAPVIIVDAYVSRSPTGLTDLNVSNGRYTYTVTGVNACGVEGPPVQVDVVVGDLNAPAAPTNLTAAPIGSDVSLQWTASVDLDVTGYHVDRLAGNGEWTRLTTTPIAPTSHLDVQLPNGTYLYRVLAVDGAGNESAPSNEAEAIVAVSAPFAPVGLTVTAPATGGVLDLGWSAPAGGSPHAGFRVFRSLDAGGPFSALAQDLVTATTYRDAGLDNGVTYFYVVRAVDLAGNEGASSNEASGTPADSTAPDRPVLSYPTDAAHPKTIDNSSTPIAGRAEPGSVVTLLRQGISLGTAAALSTPVMEEFELESEPLSAVTFDTASGRIATFAWQPGNFQHALAVTDVLTQQTRYYPQAQGGDRPAFTADGSQVVYTVYNGDSYQLSILDLDSGAVVRSVALPQYPMALAVAPDGTRAAVQLDDPNSVDDQLWMVEISAGSVTPLTNEPGGAFAPIWSPDGHRLAYSRNDGMLRLRDLDSGVAVDVGTADEGSTVFSPDGSLLAFVPSGAERDISLYDVENETATPLPEDSGDRVERSMPAFSADGAELAYFAEPLDGGDTRARVRGLATGTVFEVEAELPGDDSLFWSAEGSLVVVDDEDVARIRLPGHFRFPDVSLEPGLNLFSAIAADASGNTSGPADPISLTRDTSHLADLLIRDQDLFVYPLLPAPGERVRVAATVRNVGSAAATGVSVSFFDVDEQGNSTVVGSLQSLGTLAAGAQASAAVDWLAINGRHRLRARVDPFATVAEASETNNTAERTVDVTAPGVPTVRIAVDRALFAPVDTARVAVSAVNPAAGANFVLQVTIEDALGNVGATVLHQPLTGFSYASHDATPTWSTSESLAGSYVARATLRRSDGLTVTATAPFTILADERISVTLSTDRSAYAVGDVAQIAGTVRNLSPNVVLSDVLASIAVRNADGTEVLRSDTSIETLLIGAQAQATAQWPTLAPGTYTSTITARQGARVLGETSRTFNVNGVVTLTGTLGPSFSRVPLGQSFDISAMVANVGSLPVSGLTLRQRLAQPGSSTVVRSFERVAELAPGASVPWNLTIDSTGLSVGPYTLTFEGEREGVGVQAFASASVSVADVTAPAVLILAPAVDFHATSDVTFIARVSDDASAVVRADIRIDDGPWQQMALADPSTGTYSHRFVVSVLNAGAHVVDVRAIDTAGNDDRTSTSDANPARGQFTVGDDSNVPPVAVSLSVSTAEDTPVTIGLGASDPDNDPLTYVVTAPSHGTLSGAAPNVIYTPAPNFHGADQFTFTVRDATATSNEATVSIQVTPVNDAPVAGAGADQSVLEGASVALDGSASTDPDGDALGYRWRQADGLTAVLDLTDPARPIFQAPEVSRDGSTLVFELVVSDGTGDSAPALVRIVVGNVNRAPSATDQTLTMDEDTPLTWTVAVTDPDDDSLTFEIQPPIHGAVTGTGPDLTYTPDADFHGLDQFAIVVRDPEGLSATAHILITVAPVNDRPVASAGVDRAVDESDVVTLDGSASHDVDTDALGYEWTQIAGPAVTLVGSDTVQPTFVAPDVPAGGATLTFRLVVADAQVESVPAQVNITVSDANQPPVADAGPPQRVGSGAPVTLDGSASFDPDLDSLVFAWRQVDGAAVDLMASDAATASFVAPIVGTISVLTFELTVSDGAVSATDRVEVTVDPQNHAPAANAGADQTVRSGDLVRLDGRASTDPDGDPLTYRWTQAAGPPVMVVGETTSNATFTAPVVGTSGETLAFDLVVSDVLTDSAPDRVNIRVLARPGEPVCSAAVASPQQLWPPNHQMVRIVITGFGDRNTDGDPNDPTRLKIRILAISQDEPVNGTGDGDTGPDAILDGQVPLLRAERAGDGNGRVYQIRFTATDPSGAACKGSVLVNVPRDSKTPAVDDGQKFDSTRQSKK